MGGTFFPAHPHVSGRKPFLLNTISALATDLCEKGCVSKNQGTCYTGPCAHCLACNFSWLTPGLGTNAVTKEGIPVTLPAFGIVCILYCLFHSYSITGML